MQAMPIPLPEVIRQLQAGGHSQYAIAEAVGSSQPTISRLASGVVPPIVDVADRLRALDPKTLKPRGAKAR